WENQQLARQALGAQAARGLYGAAAGLAQGANASNVQGISNLQNAGMLPYQTLQSGLSSVLNSIGTLGQYGQQANLPIQQQIADYNAYQGLGSPSAQIGQQQMVNQANANFGQGIGNLVTTGIQAYQNATAPSGVTTSLGTGFYNPNGWGNSTDYFVGSGSSSNDGLYGLGLGGY
ncbi:MAG: hypothetical protein U7M05_11625, partial [Candidatus Igneacidithiobacillus chanchocoensis]